LDLTLNETEWIYKSGPSFSVDTHGHARGI